MPSIQQAVVAQDLAEAQAQNLKPRHRRLTITLLAGNESPDEAQSEHLARLGEAILLRRALRRTLDPAGAAA